MRSLKKSPIIRSDKNTKRKKQREKALILINDRRLEFIAVKGAVTPAAGFALAYYAPLRNCLSIEIFSAPILLVIQLYGVSTDWGTVHSGGFLATAFF